MEVFLHLTCCFITPPPASARQGGQKVSLHHQVTAEEFRDQRVGQEEAAGVDPG